MNHLRYLKKLVIVALMFLAGFVNSCELFQVTPLNNDPFATDDGFDIMGFKVGNTTYFQYEYPRGFKLWNKTYQSYSDGQFSGCVFFHCMGVKSSYDSYLSSRRNLYSAEQAINDTLIIWSYLVHGETGDMDGPTIPYKSLSFFVNMSGINEGDSVSLPVDDVFLYVAEDGNGWISWGKNSQRASVTSFSLSFNTINYLKKQFAGTFCMTWNVEYCDSSYTFSTEDGVFYMDLNWNKDYENNYGLSPEDLKLLIESRNWNVFTKYE